MPEIPEEPYVAIIERLARIETTLQQIRLDREETIDQIRRERDDHEGRIRALERWRWSLPAGLLTAIASAILAAYSTLGR